MANFFPAPIPPAQVMQPLSSIPSMSKPWRHKGCAVAEASFVGFIAVTSLVIGILSIASLADPKLARVLGFAHTSSNNIKLIGGLLIGVSLPVAAIGYHQLNKGKKSKPVYQEELAAYNYIKQLTADVATIIARPEGTAQELAQKGNSIFNKMVEIRDQYFKNLSPAQGKVNFVLNDRVLRISYDPNAFNTYGTKALQIIRHLNYRLDQLVQLNRSKGEPLEIAFVVMNPWGNNTITSIIRVKPALPQANS